MCFGSTVAICGLIISPLWLTYSLWTYLYCNLQAVHALPLCMNFPIKHLKPKIFYTASGTLKHFVINAHKTHYCSASSHMLHKSHLLLLSHLIGCEDVAMMFSRSLGNLTLNCTLSFTQTIWKCKPDCSYKMLIGLKNNMPTYVCGKTLNYSCSHVSRPV